jgi:integrase
MEETEEGCSEIVMVPWPHRLQEPMLLDTFKHYLDEHARPKGCYVPRIARSAANLCAFHGYDRHPLSLKRADHRAYTDHRQAQGVVPATVRRELAMLSAAINHDFKEERLTAGVKIPLPPMSAPRKRFLSEEEMRRVMAQPMSHRIRMFFRLAFGTAARARAIEELTWDRVSFVNGIIDFNVPGARRTNKRRAVIPMSDELRRVLEAAFIRPTRNTADPYVIGLGERGKLACTWKECKAVMVAAGINERGVARHVARKTWASHALQNGVPMALVAGVLADRPTTVQDHYGFLLPEHLRGAVNFRDHKPA